MTIIVSPLLPTVEETITWLTERGAVHFTIWRGPDGLLRGNGRVPATPALLAYWERIGLTNGKAGM